MTWPRIPASGAVYSDVEGHRKNPELKMVVALKEMLDRPGETLIDVDLQRLRRSQ